MLLILNESWLYSKLAYEKSIISTCTPKSIWGEVHCTVDPQRLSKVTKKIRQIYFSAIPERIYFSAIQE